MGLQLLGQNAYRKSELSLTSENDAYLLNGTDEYYSNGLFLNYRTAQGDSASFVKKILEFELAHKFYTPDGLISPFVQDYDRPYAALLYGGISQYIFPSNHSRLKYGVNLGTTGRPAAGDAIQIWYHNVFGFKRPRGWANQVSAALVLDGKLEYNRQVILSEGSADIVTRSKTTIGTGHINFSQGFDLRLGRLRLLNTSSFLNGVIGKGSRGFDGEGYALLGYSLGYVVHDITVEGSMFNNESPHTEVIEPWVRHLRIGWATSSNGATFKMTYHLLSREVKGAEKHGYIAFDIEFRLKK